MLRLALRRVSSLATAHTRTGLNSPRFASGSASRPSLSIWRRKKEIGKEGLIVAKELKRLRSDPVRLDRFIASHVSRLLKSDLVAVLAEFQRQDQVFLCMMVRSLRFHLSFLISLFFHLMEIQPFLRFVVITHNSVRSSAEEVCYLFVCFLLRVCLVWVKMGAKFHGCDLCNQR